MWILNRFEAFIMCLFMMVSLLAGSARDQANDRQERDAPQEDPAVFAGKEPAATADGRSTVVPCPLLAPEATAPSGSLDVVEERVLETRLQPRERLLIAAGGGGR